MNQHEMNTTIHSAFQYLY